MNDASRGVASAVSGGMGAALEAFASSVEYRRAQRDGAYAVQAATWEHHARWATAQCNSVIDERDVLAKKLDAAHALIEQRSEMLLEAHTKLGRDIELLTAERDQLKSRLQATWSVLSRIVEVVRSRTPVGYFPELTDESIKKALQQAQR